MSTSAASRTPWRGRRSEAHVEPRAVLAGLRPSLVIDLASLSGASLEDLRATLQLMPWGDRAALAAFGIIRHEEEGDRASRKISVSPAALDLVNAAAEVVARAADPDAVARVLDAALTDDPRADATERSETPVGGTVAVGDMLLLPGRVGQVWGDAGDRRVNVVLYTDLRADGMGGAHFAHVELLTDEWFSVDEPRAVTDACTPPRGLTTVARRLSAPRDANVPG